MDALDVELLAGPEALAEVSRRPGAIVVAPRMDRLARPAELLPLRPAHVLARDYVRVGPVAPIPRTVEGAALGGQPALSLSRGDPPSAKHPTEPSTNW